MFVRNGKTGMGPHRHHGCAPMFWLFRNLFKFKSSILNPNAVPTIHSPAVYVTVREDGHVFVPYAGKHAKGGMLSPGPG